MVCRSTCWQTPRRDANFGPQSERTSHAQAPGWNSFLENIIHFQPEQFVIIAQAVLCILWRKDLFTEPKGKTILSGACNYFAKGINLYIKRWWGFSPSISPQKGALAKFRRVRMCRAMQKGQHRFHFWQGIRDAPDVWLLKTLKGVAVSPLTQRAKSGSISRFYLGLISKAAQRTERDECSRCCRTVKKASERAHSKV